MKKFSLQLLFRIIGIGSASGLFLKGDLLYVIADNSGFLYQYNMAHKTLDKIPVFQKSAAENIPKKQKPDYEAISGFDDKLYIFGSGSTSKRNLLAVVSDSGEVVETDITAQYQKLKSIGRIADSDFNIEGAIITQAVCYLFQRGNGAKGKNGIFEIRGNFADNDFTADFHSITLPKIRGVEYTFTDAILEDDRIYFLATAENSDSTYLDGEVFGSLVGILDPKTMKVLATQAVSDSHKLEGMALVKTEKNKLTFIVSEDNDTDMQESDIYELILEL